MDALIQKLIYFGLLLVLIAAIWKTVKAYLEDKPIKGKVKEFIIICVFLGAAPGLVTVASNLGEAIVPPLKAVTDYVSGTVANDLKNSVPKGN